MTDRSIPSEKRPPSVAVVGASRDRAKYGNLAVRAHRDAGYQVYPINPHAGEIEGLTAYASLADLPVDHVDRVSLYVLPGVSLSLLDQIARLSPEELWLNPGAESDELAARAAALGLHVVESCSIVNAKLRPVGPRPT